MAVLLFPGQGSQHVAMGKEMCEKHPRAQELFKQADEILGFDLSKVMFEGTEDDLKKAIWYIERELKKRV